MSVMDVRRLVRALGFGALAFLVVGGGIGLASAGDSSQGDNESWRIPLPGPGDRASYRITQVVDPSVADPDLSLPDSRLDVEWLPEGQSVAPDFTLRAAHPMAATLRYVRHDFQSVVQVSYDAATGAPLSRAYQWTSSFAVPVRLVVTQPESGATVEGRRESFQGPLAPCGLRADLQGRTVRVGDEVQVFGGCEDAPEASSAAYMVRGRDDVGGKHLLKLQSKASGLVLHYDPALPVPVRVEAHMQETWDPVFAVGRTFVLDLEGFHAGQGAYPVVTGPAVIGSPGPLPLVPTTPWGLDDSGVAHRFPLAKAYATAMDPGSYRNGDDSVPDFMRRHPRAYLAFAWGEHHEDSRGTPYEEWGLLWTDRDASIAKIVVLFPTAFYAQVPVAAAPSWPYVTAWDTDLIARAHDIFPTPSALPAALPSLASLWPRASGFVQASLGAEPNTYSMTVFCAASGCQEADVTIFAGYTLYPGNQLDLAVQDQTGRTALVGVDANGRPAQAFLLDSKYQAPWPVLPAAESPPPQAAPAHASRAAVLGWSLPPGKVVAGAGALALLASALYYVWPAARAGALGLFSRIEPDRVLEHPARRTLHALVEANPGIHFQELARRSGFGRGQLEHHLRKLQAADLVSRVQGQSYACFFARGQVDRRVMAAAPLLRSEGGRSILAALQQRPGASSRDLAAQLGLAAGTVSYHVKRLREAGLLESAAGALHLTETGRQATALAA